MGPRKKGIYEFTMNDILLIVLVVLVLFLSTLIRSAVGFGNALLAMPLLVLLLGIQAASPLVALAGLVIALIMLLRDWKNVAWQDTLVLLISSLAGLPLGVMLLTALPEETMRIILGLILIGFGLYNLFGIKLPVIDRPLLAMPFGFLAGILGGAYNANGPPIVIYGVMRGWSKETYRASLQGFFLVSGLIIVAGHGLGGLWTSQVWQYLLISLPGLVAAIFLGEMITKKITQANFNRVIYIFLILMGILMFI